MAESKLEAFFAQNAKQLPEKEIIVSNRFTDADGNPIPWKIKSIDAGTYQSLRSDALDMNVKTEGGSKDVNVKYNTAKMNIRKVVASVVFPDLKNKALQDSYGVSSAAALIGVMLSDSEFDTLLDAVNDLSKNTEPEAVEEEAKN